MADGGQPNVSSAAPMPSLGRRLRMTVIAGLLVVAVFAARLAHGYDIPAFQTTPDTKSMESGVVVPYTEGADGRPPPPLEEAQS